MQLKQSFSSLFVLFILILCIAPSWSDALNHEIQYSETPTWVQNYSIDFNTEVPLADIEEGIYFRVVESQTRHIKASPDELYVRRALEVVSAQGMEYSSSFNIDFDPTYQTVELHEIKVVRNNQTLDKKSSANISVIQREKRMDALIYDGRLTANVIIDDVRVGDVVEYSYSRVGRNPIYGNTLSISRQTNYSVPVQQLNIRLVTDNNTYLESKSLKTNSEIVKKEIGLFDEYSVRDENTKVIRYEANTPKWFDPYGKVYFTELASWGEVVDWVLPLYDEVISTNAEVNKIAGDIKANNRESSDQISAALQFVQNEIRYLGIENGLNSHMPSPISETLKRRYGDCKDKAVLLISILQALGIEGFPALVNTEMGIILDTMLPSNNVFDHVIVKVNDGLKSYWLDPTNRHQSGSINFISEAKFGYALVVEPGVDELENMNDKETRAIGRINEEFDLLGDISSAVSYSIDSHFYEKMAENVRYDLVADGVAGTQEKYINYYKRYYPGIVLTEQLKTNFSDDQVSIKEHYSITDFWDESGDSQGVLGDFYANYISSVLVREDSNNRVSPFSLGKRKHVTQVIKILLPDDGWSFSEENVIEKNDVFDFEYQVKFDQENSVLSLTYDLNLKKEFVSGEGYQQYLENRGKIVDLLSYRIIKYHETASITSDQVNWSQRITMIFIGYLILSLILLITVWFFERTNRPEDDGVIFYPVSLERFYMFSIISFNIYTMYWTYRNWLYIKNHINSNVMPFGRALFNTLFFYSFNRYFKLDSEKRYGENNVYSSPLAAFLMVIYLFMSIVHNGPVYILALLIIPLLFVTYVDYINLINNQDSALYKYNTTWSWKHIPMVLFFTPILTVSVLGEFYLIPSSNVEKGQRIWSHDLRFMKREGILSAGEDIQYFFSNDFWSIRADGNGFSENNVFSYWNENDQLSIEKASFENIKDIAPQYGESYGDDTIVTISRYDDTNFLLFLSGDKEKDRVFVSKMKEYWEASKVKEAALN